MIEKLYNKQLIESDLWLSKSFYQYKPQLKIRVKNIYQASWCAFPAPSHIRIHIFATEKKLYLQILNLKFKKAKSEHIHPQDQSLTQQHTLSKWRQYLETPLLFRH